eukprot:TRINITY_DN2227_c0_g1_i1.p1 TRINITY_DN2227_c0_g1~~TRINITY_DN2227_c0_g1_i1.p1  ORF type:complete len:361 (+),score=49.35 TRINITY_DN2227_c0_g1_i1:679-1761(+)
MASTTMTTTTSDQGGKNNKVKKSDLRKDYTQQFDSRLPLAYVPLAALGWGLAVYGGLHWTVSNYCSSLNDLVFTVPLLGSVVYYGSLWIPVFVFHRMDERIEEATRNGSPLPWYSEYKLRPRTSSSSDDPAGIKEPPFWEMAKLVFWNELVQSTVIATLILALFKNSLPTEVIHSTNYDVRPVFWVSFLWLFPLAFAFDIAFYIGHRLMHLPKIQDIHVLHHSSFATSAISVHYMSPVDFFLESFFPSAISVISCFAIPNVLMPLLGIYFSQGDYSAAWVSCFSSLCCAIITFFGFGAINSVWVHSGYVFPYLPDPREHYLHHMKFRVNFSFALDRLLGTCQSWDDHLHIKQRAASTKQD